MITPSPVDTVSAAFDPPSAGVGVGKAARQDPSSRAVSLSSRISLLVTPPPGFVCDGFDRRSAPAAGLLPTHCIRIGQAADELMRLEDRLTHGGASCTVEWAMPLPDRARWVRAVHTAPERRRQGDATALMRSVIAQADALGIALVLEPKPEDDTIDAQSLERWYRSLGFVTIQREPVLLLARAPSRKE